MFSVLLHFGICACIPATYVKQYRHRHHLPHCGGSRWREIGDCSCSGKRLCRWLPDLHDVKERFLVSGLPFWRLQRYNNWKGLLWTSWLFLTLLVTSWLFYHFRQRSFCLGSSVKVQAPSPHSTFSYKRELRMGLGAFTSENFVCLSWESLPRVSGAFPKGRSDGAYGTCGWLLCPLAMLPKGLGDSSFTPKGMLCVTHRRHRSTPITDIGTSDKLYLYHGG